MINSPLSLPMLSFYFSQLHLFWGHVKLTILEVSFQNNNQAISRIQQNGPACCISSAHVIMSDGATKTQLKSEHNQSLPFDVIGADI